VEVEVALVFSQRLTLLTLSVLKTFKFFEGYFFYHTAVQYYGYPIATGNSDV